MNTNRVFFILTLILFVISCSNHIDCKAKLSSTNYHLKPRLYKQTFDKCQSEEVTNNKLVKQYVYVLIETGEFKYLQKGDWLNKIPKTMRDNWKGWVSKIDE